MPSVALVLVFNALILWTLVTVSVEWARHGSPSLTGFARTLKSVVTNPIVAAILAGTLFGLSGVPLPAPLDRPLAMIGQAAAPMSLIVLGMGLAESGVRDGWRISAAVCVLKLAVQPLVVWGLARLLGLPPLETQAVVLLGSLAVGANVYLMSRQFGVLEGAVATSLVLSRCGGIHHAAGADATGSLETDEADGVAGRESRLAEGDHAAAAQHHFLARQHELLAFLEGDVGAVAAAVDVHELLAAQLDLRVTP